MPQITQTALNIAHELYKTLPLDIVELTAALERGSGNLVRQTDKKNLITGAIAGLYTQYALAKADVIDENDITKRFTTALANTGVGFLTAATIAEIAQAIDNNTNFRNLSGIYNPTHPNNND